MGSFNNNIEDLVRRFSRRTHSHNVENFKYDYIRVFIYVQYSSKCI